MNNENRARGDRPQPPTGKAQHLSLARDLRKPQPAERGADPYNTSGSFDRTKNWARVGKR